MKLLKILLLNIFLVSTVHASTFVGNGGNAGDIELQVALDQIQQTLNLLIKNSDDPELRLCTCYEKYKEHSVCNNLRRLSEPQVQYCARLIRHKSKELTKLLSDKGAIHFSWTSDDINVKEKSGLRAVDAVTDYKNKTITLNRKNFVEMNSTERVFLLTHELFHLTDLNGVPLSDDLEYPNFPGSQGGRQLLNSIASALVIESYDYGSFQEYGKPLQRSQGHKRNWIDLYVNTMSTSPQDSSVYAAGTLSGGAANFRHHFYNEWATVFSFASLKKDHGILTSIEATEQRYIFGFGLSYRWFPFAEPLTFWGQSHFVFTGKYETLLGKITVKDNFIDIKDDATSSSPSFGVSYYIPFSNNFWGFAGASFSAHKINYEKIPLDYKSQNFLMDLGVSYAF
ncbi:MAG TPA: hypothetical protein VGE46_05385 [Bdellovibrio sp.]